MEIGNSAVNRNVRFFLLSHEKNKKNGRFRFFPFAQRLKTEVSDFFAIRRKKKRLFSSSAKTAETSITRFFPFRW